MFYTCPNLYYHFISLKNFCVFDCFIQKCIVFILKYTRNWWLLWGLHPSHSNCFGKNQNHKTKPLKGHVNLNVGAVCSKSPLLGVGD